MFYDGLRLWEVRFAMFCKGVKLWENRFVVFYEGLRLWEVHLYVFYVSGRLSGLTELTDRVCQLKKDLHGRGGRGRGELGSYEFK